MSDGDSVSESRPSDQTFNVVSMVACHKSLAGLWALSTCYQPCASAALARGATLFSTRQQRRSLFVSQHTREARVFTRQILSPSGGRTQRAISACEHVPTTYTQACAPWIHTQIACFNSISQADLPKQSKSVNSPNQSTFLIHQSCMPNRDRAYECKT